jgi:hypothetical protein
MVFFDKFLDSSRRKGSGFVGIEEELEELAEKGIESLVFRSEAEEVRPAS